MGSREYVSATKPLSDDGGTDSYWTGVAAKPGGRVIEMLSEHSQHFITQIVFYTSLTLMFTFRGTQRCKASSKVTCSQVRVVWDLSLDTPTSRLNFCPVERLGRHGLFPSYEAFLGIVTTMVCSLLETPK